MLSDLLANDSVSKSKPLGVILGFDKETETGWATMYNSEGDTYRVHIAEKVAEAKERAKHNEETKNQGRYHHYLKNLKYGTDLGDFAFNATPKNYPHDVLTKGGQNIYTMLMHERNRRWRKN